MYQATVAAAPPGGGGVCGFTIVVEEGQHKANQTTKYATKQTGNENEIKKNQEACLTAECVQNDYKDPFL